MPKQPIKKFSNSIILENPMAEGGGTIAKPLTHLSLDPVSCWAQVEDAFFERGIAEENAAIEQYALLPAKDQKENKVRPIRPVHFLWAGCGIIFLIASVLFVSRLLHRPGQAAVTEQAAAEITEPFPVAVTIDAEVVMDAEVDVQDPSDLSSPLDTQAREVPATVEVSAPTVTPTMVVADAGEIDACRQGIENKQAKVINETCPSALASDPSLVEPLMKWARGEFERGRTAMAFRWARRIVEINPAVADAYVIIGMAEQTANHLAAAKIAYKRYLDLAPKGAFAHDVRSALSLM